MIQRKGKIIGIVIGILFCCVVGIVIFFSLPYSKTHTEFLSAKNTTVLDARKDFSVFTEEDIYHLPLPVKKYFRYCGFIGMPKMQTMVAVYKDVVFRFGKGKPRVIIDYVQYNSVVEPARIAYIDSSLYGIPFEGLDSYRAGKGSMKGVLAKFFTLFEQNGEAMDRASLVTFLSECLLIPSVAIQQYIAWEEIDALHALATISWYGRTASGIFTFTENEEMCCFTTNDRLSTSIGDKSEPVRWTVGFSEYVETKGSKKPTGFQAIWHYDDGDLLYFEGKNVVIEYDLNEQ